MTLTEKYVSGMTLRLLSHLSSTQAAKTCSLEMLDILAERDREWKNWLATNFNIHVDLEQLDALYKDAKKAVNSY